MELKVRTKIWRILIRSDLRCVNLEASHCSTFPKTKQVPLLRDKVEQKYQSTIIRETT